MADWLRQCFRLKRIVTKCKSSHFSLDGADHEFESYAKSVLLMLRDGDQVSTDFFKLTFGFDFDFQSITLPCT